ncbi:M14 family zinc carboxypeptidase [Belliella pelovolcani]|uniref:Zinc carboxypeptidase n=1 Tax=Belliella pelovolcani TaxID=529505 RepID=A0A1N7KQT6_9BACT|nr:M14 family zinc carboxypeptidase [Belliella pelovolcani]SIS63780.1 Zinc carboxypeptidase [Belliella pelovolcani]
MKKHTLVFLSLMWITLISCDRQNQTFDSVELDLLEAAFETYQEKSVQNRRFKYADVIHLITDRVGLFEVEKLGESVHNKAIYQLSVGEGKVKVMLWSQMHGNESTATMALFDLMNFLEADDQQFQSLRNTILQNLQIRIIPMVNPDGMDMWIRRNALEIDLNRDAVALVSPEAKILKEARDTFEPEFGFNLHDQQIYYNVSGTAKPATISVLAPAYNYETEVNEVRKRAMQVIIGMNQMLQQTIPGQVGKYDDAFEPRAFGDNFQKWGTSTILIESGGYVQDPEKQYIRKLNFMMMLHALIQIAEQTYPEQNLDDYYAIPDNDLKMMDLLIKNLSLESSGYTYQADLGIRRREGDTQEGYYVNGSIEDIGDLSVFYGYETLDASGLQIREGKVYDIPFEQITDITEERAYELLQKGYLAVSLKDTKGAEVHSLPILTLSKNDKIPFSIRVGGSPNFYLAKGEDMKFAIVNGYLIDLQNKNPQEYRMKVQ